MKKKTSVYRARFSKEGNIKVNDSDLNENPLYQITPAYNLNYINEKDPMVNNLERDIIDLRIESGICNLLISCPVIIV